MKNSRIDGEVIRQFLETRQENEESLFAHPSYTLEQDLLYWVELTDEQRASRVLDQINAAQRARLSDSQVRSLKNSLICSCTLFTRATIKAGVTPEYAYDMSDIFIRKIENTNGLDQLHKLEYDMLHHFIQAIRDYRQNPYQNEIVNRAIHYIHENILQPMTLEKISEAINVSPNYLSALFHSVTNIRMNAYINKKKVDESKYFLSHTDSTLLDIALLFGFCNQSYYTRVFKEHNGITPAAFRRRHADEDVEKKHAKPEAVN
ncbi:Regulatory protein PocR [Lentibacillus sp. JNUCC-1]|uniref:helix-turn-helix domain-containing protein n=1 Tax=Lentibacillus sp. JNUCC-1 TaxID=2654513 RepID=UPI0012E78649|nr:AraC family transcriptional regulator [Lentibacillus sp. JNUCC-1]MUV36773.1 Regulatory protein PocR [Lentibacillus sp. JNUCC-1]